MIRACPTAKGIPGFTDKLAKLNTVVKVAFIYTVWRGKRVKGVRERGKK